MLVAGAGNMVKVALGDGQNICDSPIKAAVLHKLAASSCFGVTAKHSKQSTTFVRSYLDRKPQDVLLFFVFSTADEAEFSKKLKAENLRFGDRGCTASMCSRTTQPGPQSKMG
jgi:hypothetical protein